MIVVFSAVLLCSCSVSENRSSVEVFAHTLNAEEAKEAVKELIPKADELYRIFYRGEMAADETKAVTEPNGFRYAPVTEKYDTLSELKNDAEKIFTLGFLEENFYKNLNDEYAFFKDINGKLYKNLDIVSEGKDKWYAEYTVIDVLNDDSFTATVPYTDVYDTQRSSKLTVINDNDFWKIDKWELNLPAEK